MSHVYRYNVARILMLASIIGSATLKSTPITLESSLIHYVDGIFINGRRICEMRKLQLGIGFLAIGKKNRDGVREPLYGFHIVQNDASLIYVICSDGATLELYQYDPARAHAALLGTYDLKKTETLPHLPGSKFYTLTIDPIACDITMQELNAGQQNILEYLHAPHMTRHSLHSLMGVEQVITKHTSVPNSYFTMAQNALPLMLDFMKRDFAHKTEKFIDDASLFKRAMVGLIQESCTKRGREDSLLLEWAKSEKGHEMLNFNQNVRTFKDFYTFSGDLISFLGDLMHSCPKAMKQFKELMEQN